MRLVHLELKAANAFVAAHHRHHKPVVGHRFSLGAEMAGALVGVAIVGRPVARGWQWQEVLEVNRLCTDGTKNACSFLYSAAARAGKALGYRRIITYILESETGGSLVASGWSRLHTTAGGEWKHTKGSRRTDQPNGPKSCWGRELNERR